MSVTGLARKEAEQEGEPELTALDLALLGMATYRAGRLVAYDDVMEPLRSPFTQTEPSTWGAGKDVVARGHGTRRALGELISCPTCVSTWIALFLVAGMRLFPAPTRLILAILSTSGMAELLNAANESLQWGGRAARQQADEQG